MKEEAEIENSSGDGEDRAGGTGTAVKYGVLGALAAVLCCVGPLVPILLGLGGATALFGLDRYTPLFFTLGLLILAGASWMAVRRQNRCCSVRSSARNIKTVALIFGVGIGAYLILQFAVVPTLASVASSKVAEARPGGSAIQGQALRLHVDGMTCAGCSVGVESALLDVPGVLSAKADWKTGYAWVTIDPSVAKPTDLLQAEVEFHYTLSLAEEIGQNQKENKP